MEIQGIIFDCDGTLANTMPLHWRAWQIITRKHRLYFPEERFYYLGGVPARDIVQMLCEEQGRLLDCLAVAKEKEGCYLETLQEIEPIEQVVAIAREHLGKVPMAVASGGTREIIGMVLRHLGLQDLFQSVVTSEDVACQKPAPDIYLEAARRIDVPPHLCRAYEDTETGMKAIRAAGMHGVDVRKLLRESMS